MLKESARLQEAHEQPKNIYKKQTEKGFLGLKSDGKGEQTCKLRKRTPASMAMFRDVIYKDFIFFRSPWPFLQTLPVTTWRPPHFFFFINDFQTTNTAKKTLI